MDVSSPYLEYLAKRNYAEVVRHSIRDLHLADELGLRRLDQRSRSDLLRLAA